MTALYEVVRDNLETLYGAIGDGALAVRIPKHARSPPYWKSRVLRRQVLGDEDEGAGRGHRAGEEVA